MRSLGFGLQEKIDVAVQDEYGKLYGQKLNESHVSALAAIFGWTVEEGVGGGWGVGRHALLTCLSPSR